MSISRKQLADLRMKRMTVIASEEKTLKQLYNGSNFNEDLYLLGEYCYSHPEKMQELDEKILNNKNFVSGYKKAKRLELIADLTDNSTNLSQSKSRK